MKKYKTCQNISPNLPAAYLQQHGITFAQLYQSPDDLARYTLAMQPADSHIVNLPRDCCLEAELMGATMIGYDQSDILSPVVMQYTQELPTVNLEHWRLRNIMQALEQINADSQAVCFNLSGFAAVFDAVYGSGLFYTEWFRHHSYAMKFITLLQNSYLRIIEMALEKNIRLFSFAEPTLLLSLIGETFAAEYSEEVLLPFLRKINALATPLVFHICGMTTEVLQTSGKISLHPVTSSDASSSDDMLKELCMIGKSPVIIGNNCINQNRSITHLDEICLSLT